MIGKIFSRFSKKCVCCGRKATMETVWKNEPVHVCEVCGIPTSSGKIVPVCAISRWVVKVKTDEGWKELDVFENPIYPDDIEDIDQFPAVKCDMYDIEGKRVGVMWSRKSESPRSKNVLFEMVEKYRQMQEELEAVKETFSSRDSIVRGLKELRQEYEELRTLFGDRDRTLGSNVPWIIQVLKDRDLKQNVVEIIREAASSFGQGLREGAEKREVKAKKRVMRIREYGGDKSEQDAENT